MPDFSKAYYLEHEQLIIKKQENENLQADLYAMKANNERLKGTIHRRNMQIAALKTRVLELEKAKVGISTLRIY